jgi:enoyl-[acyl-carrier protein] reductase I
MAEQLPGAVPPPVIELDVTASKDLDALPARIRTHLDEVDGIVHSIAFAPAAALGGGFVDTSWPDVATAMEVSAYSLSALTRACCPILATGGASIVGLDFDARLAWPGYDWMGVSKAALESITRYLAFYLGPRDVRVNLVAAGLVTSMAARAVPAFDRFSEIWSTRPPLKWDIADPVPAAQACAVLLSDWLPRTTGEILHVDGGLHAVMS